MPVHCCQRNNAACLHCYPPITLRPSSIVAYLRKRNVVLSHCYNSANVIEPREPHTCNNTIHLPMHNNSHNHSSLCVTAWAYNSCSMLSLQTSDESRDKNILTFVKTKNNKSKVINFVLQPLIIANFIVTIMYQFTKVCDSELLL
jgi:hypothetical protein